jgi:hypothetical protein
MTPDRVGPLCSSFDLCLKSKWDAVEETKRQKLSAKKRKISFLKLFFMSLSA